MNYSSNYTSTILLDFNSTNYINRVRQLQVPNDTKSWLMGFVMTIYESDLEERYDKPMVWIGKYIALASLCCILAMVADLLHGTRSRKLWFPCNYFTINAASLAVIAVAMKLPVDLSGSMPGTVDQVAKLGSVAFMCTMMANLLPCLATMDSNAMLANITALGVLVITLVVNVCIQIQTGVVSSRGRSKIIRDPRDIQMVYFEIPGIVLEGGYPDPLEVLFGVSYPTIAAIYVTMLLVLLIIHVSSSLAILKSKQIIELKYQKAHEAASTYIQQLTGDMLTVEKPEPYVENYWIMAGSGSPQFIINSSSGNKTNDLKGINKTNDLKGINYVLQLENEKELAERTLKGLSKSFKQLIRRSEKKQPKNLMNLIKTKTTKGFQGVRMFGNNDHHVQCSSLKVECRDCWSLAVVTLATIVLTLRMIKNDKPKH
ncbi:hypothetical protein Hanom_Chr07g00608011 [Helianthus anomalus]